MQYQLHISDGPFNPNPDYKYILLYKEEYNALFYVDVVKTFPDLFGLNKQGMPSENTDSNFWEYYLLVKAQQMPMIKVSNVILSKLKEIINA